MNKQNNLFWIGYYFGLNCILHPYTGRWILTGYFDGQVVCHREVPNIDEDDCLMCPIEEVQFVFKRINPFLFKSVSNLNLFVKKYAMEGYWMNFDEKFNNQIVFES